MTTTVSGDLLRSIDKVRADLNISRADLAEAVDVDPATMWRLLTGRTQRPDPKLISACLVHLGRTVQRRAAVL